MRLPGVYETFKKTRKKYASDVAAEYSGTGVKQGCALHKHSYSARCATKMLLGILFARLDVSIERTAIGSERVYRPSRAFQLSDQWLSIYWPHTLWSLPVRLHSARLNQHFSVQLRVGKYCRPRPLRNRHSAYPGTRLNCCRYLSP